MACPASWIAAGSGCYRVTAKAVVHWQCEALCASYSATGNASLACIGSAEENNSTLGVALESLRSTNLRGITILQTPRLWTGLYQRADSEAPSAGWDECTTGEATGYVNWALHGTVHRRFYGVYHGACAAMRLVGDSEGRWFDYACSRALPCLCEHGASTSPAYAAFVAAQLRVFTTWTLLTFLLFVPLLSLLPLLVCCGFARTRRLLARSPPGDAADAGGYTEHSNNRNSTTSDAERSHSRAAAAIALAGWALCVLGVTPYAMWILVIDLTPTAGHPYNYVGAVCWGLPLLLLSLRPTGLSRSPPSGVTIAGRAFVVLFVALAVLFLYSAYRLASATTDLVTFVAIALMFLALAVLTAPVATNTMPPSRQLQRLWLALRLFSVCAAGLAILYLSSIALLRGTFNINAKTSAIMVLAANGLLATFAFSPAICELRLVRLGKGVEPRDRGAQRAELGCTQEIDLVEQHAVGNGDLHAGSASLSLVAEAAPQVPQIAPEDVVPSTFLGEGGFGSVWLALWRTSIVAVKVIDRCEVSHALEGNSLEARLLARLRHPSICTFFGTTTVRGHSAMVLEYLEGGSLAQLRDRRGAIAPPLLLRLALEIAAGLAFLHCNGIIHRDVKADNVLLDTAQHAKVTDFGTSKVVDSPPAAHAGGDAKSSPLSPPPRGLTLSCELTAPLSNPHVSALGTPAACLSEQDTSQAYNRRSTQESAEKIASDAMLASGVDGDMAAAMQHTSCVGTFRYAAPEVLRSVPLGGMSALYNELCDVYAFGLLLWEMANSKRAFEDMNGMAASFTAMKGARPPLSNCGCEELRALIQTCWQHDPLHRMTMRACEERLAILHRKVQRLEDSAATSRTAATAQPIHEDISMPEHSVSSTDSMMTAKLSMPEPSAGSSGMPATYTDRAAADSSELI